MKSKRIGFRDLVILGGAALMFIPALTAGWFYTGALQRETERIISNGLRLRGELATDLLARRLYASWRAINTYANSADIHAGLDARRDFTIMAQLDDRIAWIGMADLQGRVLAGSRGMLEGENVSDQPWFRRGLTEPFAGDVHESPLLAKLLAKRDEPIRLVDFSAPIRDADGGIVGVMGVHIRWEWVRQQLAGMSARGVDVLLLSRDRRVRYGPAELEEQTLGIGAAVAAGHVDTVVRPETWPDGRSYMTAVIPAVRYEDLPNFRWSVIVREDLGRALEPMRQLARTFWIILGSAGLLSLGLLALGAGWLATPLRRQTEFASALAEAQTQGPPYVETRYREVADLSSALVRLQSKMGLLSKP